MTEVTQFEQVHQCLIILKSRFLFVNVKTEKRIPCKYIHISHVKNLQATEWNCVSE
jgi:hypothetical protein